MEVVILIPKETYNTCNFPGGGGGPDLLTPHLSMDSEIKRIGRNYRYSQIYGCSIVQVDITTCYSVMFYSGQNSSITKDDNF